MDVLESFVAAHQDRLRELLGPLWPVRPFKVDQYGPLTKYTLGELPSGRWAMLHRLTAADEGPPHDHPVRFDTTIIRGGYREALYQNGQIETIDRRPGAVFTIHPDTVHRITGLLDGESWSLCFAGPVVREWRHYSEEELLRSAA